MGTWQEIDAALPFELQIWPSQWLNCMVQLHEPVHGCRYNEKMQRMQRGLDGTVDELFTYSCPKFVAATPPRLDNLTVNSNQEAYR